MIDLKQVKPAFAKSFGEAKKVHFIGIGGIGISALAQLAHHEGKIVSGTNDNPSPQTLDRVRALGVKIFIGADIKNIDADTDLIIYSTAWDDNEKEFMDRVRALGIPVLTYFEGLGLFSANKKTIAIAGTHGKTTTTGMLAKAMIDVGADPTVIVGSILAEQQGNFVPGKSELFVVEACEYRRSFLNLHPYIAVINNIDNDHLDYYKDLDDIISAFHEFANRVPADGFVVANLNDPNVTKAVQGISAKIVDFSQLLPEIVELKMTVPGEHNRKNASATLAVTRLLELDDHRVKVALEAFAGTWRRFEYKGKTENGALVYDDYGHHPTEIKATLEAAREFFGDKKIIAVFQPHLFSRTKLLLTDFAKSFNSADEIIVAPIYAAREKDDGTVSSADLVARLMQNDKTAKTFENFSTIQNYLEQTVKKDEVIMTIGAGDIYRVGEELVV